LQVANLQVSVIGGSELASFSNCRFKTCKFQLLQVQKLQVPVKASSEVANLLVTRPVGAHPFQVIVHGGTTSFVVAMKQWVNSTTSEFTTRYNASVVLGQSVLQNRRKLAEAESFFAVCSFTFLSLFQYFLL
jgi:hypothetical protein